MKLPFSSYSPDVGSGFIELDRLANIWGTDCEL